MSVIAGYRECTTVPECIGSVYTVMRAEKRIFAGKLFTERCLCSRTQSPPIDVTGIMKSEPSCLVYQEKKRTKYLLPVGGVGIMGLGHLF